MVGSCSSLSDSPAALGLFYLCKMSKLNPLIKSIVKQDYYIKTHRSFVSLLGLECGAFLSYLVNTYIDFEEKGLLKRSKKYDCGMFYMKISRVEEHLNISRRVQDRHIKRLIEMNIIYKQLMGNPAKRYFGVNIKTINEIVETYSLCTKRSTSEDVPNEQSQNMNETDNLRDGTERTNPIKVTTSKEPILSNNDEEEEKSENSSSTSGLNLMLKDKHGNTLAEIICSTMGNDYLEQIISKKKTIETFFKTVEARGLKSFLDWTNYVAKNDLEMEHLQNQLKVKPDRIRKDLKDFYAYHKGQSKLYTKKDFRNHFINWRKKQ